MGKMETKKAASRLVTPPICPAMRCRKSRCAETAWWRIAYALYSKTKNFPLARLGAAFPRLSPAVRRSGSEIFATIDDLAERVRKIGARTIHSIGEIARRQTIKDNDKPFVSPAEMLRELMADNKSVIKADARRA